MSINRTWYNYYVKKNFFASVILVISIIGAILLIKHKVEDETLISITPKLDQVFCDDIMQKAPSEIFSDGENQSVIVTSERICQENIGHNTSYLFSFENISQNAAPNFVLNIYTPDMILVQTMPIDYSWQFGEDTINLHDDINFDGYKDMLLRVYSPRATEFTYYIYNPTRKIFEPENTLSGIFSPTFNSQNKTITSTPDISNYYYDKMGDQQYYTPEEQTTVFKFKDGKYYKEN